MVAGSSINASEIFHIFVNRRDEIDGLIKQIEDAECGHIGAVLARPDTGLSAALRVARNGIGTRINVVHIDLRDGQPDALFLQTIQYVINRGKEFSERVLPPLARPGKKEILRRIIGGSAGAVPLAGSPLSQLSEIAFNLVSPDTGYLEYNRKLSEIYDLLTKFDKTCIVFDHFQRAQPNHLAQIANTLNAIPTLSAPAAQNTVDLLPSVQVTSDHLKPYLGTFEKLPAPHPSLAELIVKRISRRMDVAIHASQFPDIRIGLHAFLSRIYRFLTEHTPEPERLKQIHLDILSLLKTADTAISVAVLFHALVHGRLFILDSTAFNQELALLESLDLVEINRLTGLDTRVSLTSRGEPLAREELGTGHRDLLFSQVLYGGLVDLIEAGTLTEATFAPLLYRLAGLIDQDGQIRWRIAAITSCIATSSFVEASTMLDDLEANLQLTDEDDTLTLIAAMSTTKKYVQALKYCGSIANKNTRTAILHSILLYRSLKLDTAHEEMSALLSVVRDPEEKCILATYYIALCIDRGEIDAAAQKLIASAEYFNNTKRYGYLLNIIAATEKPVDAIVTCRRSFEVFERAGDRFGLGGAWANVGVHLIKNREFAEGLATSESAYGHLSRFGIQHVDLVANNIASALLMLGDAEAAARWVRKSLDLLQTSTIRINALTNLAAIGFLEDKPEVLKETIVEAGGQAAAQPIERIREKFCENALVLCEGLAEMPEIVRRLCRRCLPADALAIYGTVRTPTTTRDERLSILQARYSAPTNQYWYPNPMDLFEKKALSVEAYR